VVFSISKRVLIIWERPSLSILTRSLSFATALMATLTLGLSAVITGLIVLWDKYSDAQEAAATRVAVVNRPDKPFTPLITPCKAASSLARISFGTQVTDRIG